MIAATTEWFDENRGLAVSLVSAGMGVAPMTISPFARWLITAYDWRSAMMIIGIGALMLILPATSRASAAAAAARMRMRPSCQVMARAPICGGFRSPQFIVLGLTFFACCAAHSGPIFHMVSYATALRRCADGCRQHLPVSRVLPVSAGACSMARLRTGSA